MNPPLTQKWALYRSDLGDYMKRWIFRTPWGTLRIHKIMRSDEGRDFHDHPFSFTSIILSGGYFEHRPGCRCGITREGSTRWVAGPCQRFYAPAIVRRKAEDFHRLELTRPAWTFVISSPYFRQWGFLLGDGRWIHYKEYHRSFYEEPKP